ncbi:glycosyltransferase family 4 protein [Pirellulales bacterium]|nr:glycosyltransferase family 4 protein [Pirellulales bacterium]
MSIAQQPVRAVAAAAQTAAAVRPKCALQVITPSHMSGAEMVVVRMARRLSARGHQMPVLVKCGASAIEEMKQYGLSIESERIGGKLNVLAARRLAKAARLRGADLLHSHLSTASWWCGWLETFGGPPSIGHVHGFTSARWHRRQSRLLAVSEAVKQDLVGQGIRPDKVAVLYNAVANDEIQPTRDPLAVRGDLGADRDTPVVGAFGHLSEKKGYRELFAAIPNVLSSFPTAQFWIVGRGGMRDKLEQMASVGGYLKQIRFTGFRRDVADVMNAIDVMALPSHREPFGLVYVEAALLAKPTVGCRAGGAPESIADGETGLLAPVGDAAGVADAIVSLLEDRELALRMGQAGRTRALDLFSWPTFIGKLESAYDQLVG